MVCPQCGMQLVQNSIYCSSCGTNINNQAVSSPTSKKNNAPNLGIDKNQLRNGLFLAMFNDGWVLVGAITSGVGTWMMFSALFLAIIFYAYKNLQQNQYSEARNYCLAGSLLNGFFALSNISALNQISAIPVFVNELSAAVILAVVYYELNRKIKD
jgi:zinc-ribbon domain